MNLQPITPQVLRPVVITDLANLTCSLAVNPGFVQQMILLAADDQGGLDFIVDGKSIKTLYGPTINAITRKNFILPNVAAALTEGMLTAYYQGKGFKKEIREGFEGLTTDVPMNFEVVTITAESIQEDPSCLINMVTKYSDRPIVVFLSEDSPLYKQMGTQVARAVQENLHFLLVEEKGNMFFTEIRKTERNTICSIPVPQLTVDTIVTWFTQVSITGQIGHFNVFSPTKAQKLKLAEVDKQ